MAIVRWEPFGDIDRFFEDFGMPSQGRTGWDLAVDLYEEGNDVIARMNLPGVDPEKIAISVEDHHLRVSGRREEEKEEKKKAYYSKEIRRGSFERVVRLPSPVDEKKVQADYEKGVLTVTMPKAKESKERKIKVTKKGK